MKISICAPHAKERFETELQNSILDPERSVGNPEVIPRFVGKSEHSAAKQFCQNIRRDASCAGLRERQAAYKFFNSDGCGCG